MSGRDLLRRAAFFALVFAVGAAGMWAGQALRSRGAASPPGSEVAPDMVLGASFPSERVVEADGTPRDTAELTASGAVVMFLRFDCPACGQALPLWRQALGDGRLEGVPVVGITTDPPDAIRDYRRANDVPFPIYSDPERRFAERHGVTAVPFVVVVGPDGAIRERSLGHREDLDFGRIQRLASG